MGHGNPNKVDAIVEEIVKNNSIFKLKSSIEQEKEKDAISKSINNALSVLNEVGKELVLQELSIDPDEKFKGFIDSAGNIDTLGLTKMTSGIVNSKIEEAQRNGIDLRIDAPNILNNKKSEKITEGILNFAVLNSMIKNYEDLSNEDRKKITDNWENLTNRQRIDVSRKKADMLRKRAEQAENEEERQAISNFQQAEENNANIYEQLDNLPDEALDGLESQFIKEDEEAFSEFCKKYPNLSKKERLSRYKAERDKKYECEVDVLIEEENPGKDVFDASTEYLDMTIREQVASNSQILEKIGGFDYWNSLTLEEQTRVAISYFDNVPKQTTNTSEEIIKQMSTQLQELNIKKDDVSEILRICMTTLKSLEKDDIENYRHCIQDEELGKVQDEIKGFFIEDGMMPQIAEILSKIDYNGQLYEILGDEKSSQEFFEQLVKAGSFGAEFSEQIESEENQDQQLAETILSELQAIPIALQRINCQPEDIAKGMEAYRQMIGLLTPEEINSEPEALTEILKKAVGEINLDGVAGDILKMMSQITFNGQLSEILKNSKDAFITSLNGPLLDPRVYAVNPEQNNSNSSNSSSLTERVDEDTLKAGFEALAVDLQIADPTIIRPEELVTDENTQLENGQEENTELPKKEARKEKAEGAVISKLQAFFGVYRNAGMIEVQEVSEEIKEIVQELDLNLQNNNVHRVEEEIKNDEGIEQG